MFIQIPAFFVNNRKSLRTVRLSWSYPLQPLTETNTRALFTALASSAGNSVTLTVRSLRTRKGEKNEEESLPVLSLFPLLFSNRTGKPVEKANTARVLNVETWGGVMCFVAEIKPICTTQSDTEVIDFGWFQHKLDIFWHRPICGLFPSKCQSLLLVYGRLFTNHPGSIICETSSPLLLLLWVARMKLNSKKV